MKNLASGIFFVVLFLLVFTSNRVEASHALGAEITYECLGGNEYLVRLVFYRDCGGISAPTAPSISITSSCGNQNLGMTLLPPDPPFPPFDQYLVDYELPVYCEASNCSNGGRPGIQEYIYEATVTLPPCANWTLSYDLCCRSADINTINSPGNQDIYVSAFLNNQAAPCNSSPQFDVPARGFICLNQENTILATATDPDGDLLVYSLYTPWHNPNQSVNYTGGFNQNNPLSSNYYNFNNGTITTYPTNNGQITVIGVMVEEYRNGVLIGRVVRDMQVRVINNCPQNPGSDFDIDQDGIFDGDTFVMCSENQIQLDIYLNNTLPNLNYGIVAENLADFPGATFTNVPNGSAPGGIIGQFIWTPDETYIGTTQTLVMTAFDDNCPVVGYSNFTYQFTITGLELEVDIDTVAISCTDSVEMNAIVSNGTPPYDFVWNDGYVGANRWVTEGEYIVVVTDAEGCTGDDTINVYYVDDPEGAFFDPPGACVDSAIQFVDQSFSNYPPSLPPINIVNWEWDFGDGTTITGVQNPTHAYDTAGQYQVQLIVTNDLGCRDTAWSSVWANPPPNVDFEFENVCSDTLFTFTDLSTIDTGMIVGWGWDFGDGSPILQAQNATHSYQNVGWGYYPVTLVAVSDSGCPAFLTQQVHAFPVPVADFGPTDVCYGNVSSFTDLSTVAEGGLAVWNWDFGDQTYSSIQNPVHTYLDTGTFTITLIATTDSVCRDTVTKTVVVHPAPVAGFYNDTVCAQIEMSFTDTSTLSNGSIISWSWYFGDGDQSSDQNPVHTYSLGGTYTVSLVVESDMGCIDTMSKQIIVYPKPFANFNTLAACQNDENVFIDLSLVATGSTVTQWNWEFGDPAQGTSAIQSPVYVYDTSGTYTVTLIVETNFGCLDTTSETTQVYDLPQPSFTFDDICLYDYAIFQNTSVIAAGSMSNFYWDFGNNEYSTAQQPVGQQYDSAGFYDVELIVQSNYGCRDTVVETIEIFPVPTAMFTFDSVCFPYPTTFIDLSTVGGSYNVIGWTWKFGDGSNPVTVQNPTHNYAAWGDYSVQLSVVTDSGCEADTTLGPARVYPKPVAEFSDDIANCLNDTTVFDDLSSVENAPEDVLTDWYWDFADGFSSSSQDTAHVYSNHGFYAVELAVTTNNGCQDTVVYPVEIYPLPEVNFTVDTNFGCQPFRVQFQDLTQIPAPYGLSSWEWNFGDGSENVTTRHPDHTYWDVDLGDLDIGLYSVWLHVTSAKGCVSDTTFVDFITEYPKPDALFSVDPMRTDIIFPKFHITDEATPNVVNWLYEWGDGTTSTVPNPVHEYADTGYYDITQYVETQYGCKDTITVKVRVDPEFRFYIPSAFTPDDDGKNEEFFGSGIGIIDYRMRIYDRWGEQIFESNEYDYHWDGTYRGKQVQKGVYIYLFNIKDVKGNPHVYRGHVTLTR